MDKEEKIKEEKDREIWKRRIRKRRMLRLERENSIKSRKLENRGFF